MPSWKKVITSGSNAELNQITASKGIAIPQDEKLFFGFDEDAQSFIRESGNDLLIHADDDIILEPDDAFYIRVGGVFKTQFNDGRLGIGGDFTNIPPKPLTVDGDISSSGDFIGEGNISGSSTSTGSFGHVMIGGSNITATATELNIMDGNTNASNITPVDADKVVLNDDGTMRQVTLTKLATYFDDEITNMPNLTSVGTLNSLDVDKHITASGNISISGDFLNSQTIQLTAASSTVINTFNTSSFQTCKYLLQVTSASVIQSSELLVMQTGSNAFNTEYAQMNSGVNLGSFATSVSGANVKLNFAADFISCSVKFNRTLI